MDASKGASTCSWLELCITRTKRPLPWRRIVDTPCSPSLSSLSRAYSQASLSSANPAQTLSCCQIQPLTRQMIDCPHRRAAREKLRFVSMIVRLLPSPPLIQNQIRLMIGGALGEARGDLIPGFVEAALKTPYRLRVPLAPAEGLVLESQVQQIYNCLLYTCRGLRLIRQGRTNNPLHTAIIVKYNIQYIISSTKMEEGEGGCSRITTDA